jgi:hypothetical protein
MPFPYPGPGTRTLLRCRKHQWLVVLAKLQPPCALEPCAAQRTPVVSERSVKLSSHNRRAAVRTVSAVINSALATYHWQIALIVKSFSIGEIQAKADPDQRDAERCGPREPVADRERQEDRDVADQAEDRDRNAEKCRPA